MGVSPPVLLGLLFFAALCLPLGTCEGLADWSKFPIRSPDHSGGRRATVCKGHSACLADTFCHSGGGNKQTCVPCSQCQYASDSVDGRCPQTRCPGTPASIQPDLSAPTISWVFMHPGEVDVGAQKKWVDIIFKVEDEGSGFERALVLSP